MIFWILCETSLSGRDGYGWNQGKRYLGRTKHWAARATVNSKLSLPAWGLSYPYSFGIQNPDVGIPQLFSAGQLSDSAGKQIHGGSVVGEIFQDRGQYITGFQI